MTSTVVFVALMAFSLLLFSTVRPAPIVTAIFVIPTGSALICRG